MAKAVSGFRVVAETGVAVSMFVMLWERARAVQPVAVRLATQPDERLGDAGDEMAGGTVRHGAVWSELIA